jgi:hypothetical protein
MARFVALPGLEMPLESCILFRKLPDASRETSSRTRSSEGILVALANRRWRIVEGHGRAAGRIIAEGLYCDCTILYRKGHPIRFSHARSDNPFVSVHVAIHYRGPRVFLRINLGFVSDRPEAINVGGYGKVESVT